MGVRDDRELGWFPYYRVDLALFRYHKLKGCSSGSTSPVASVQCCVARVHNICATDF